MEVASRAGWAPLDLAAACLRGGARCLQIRAKAIGGAELLDLSTRLADLAHRAGAVVIVNDRADIARLSGADGVHVGQDDLSPAAARALVGAAAIVGLSTHTRAQIDVAIGAAVDYIAVGPVFSTVAKTTPYAPVGLDLVRYAAEKSRPALGVVAIGGITLDRAPAVIAAGATMVAVITDLVVGGDPEARVRAYLACLDGRV